MAEACKGSFSLGFGKSVLSEVSLRKALRGYLKESVNIGDIYHFTYFVNLISILESNSLVSSQEEHNIPFISFTRNRRFEADTVFGTHCYFVVDGTKLSNSYKIVPYNYFYRELAARGFDPPLHMYQNSEQEERLIFTRPPFSIINFKKYVKKIVFLSKALLEDDFETVSAKDPSFEKVLGEDGELSIESLAKFVGEKYGVETSVT